MSDPQPPPPHKSNLRPHASNFNATASAKFPHYSRPLPIGCFSVDAERRMLLNDRRHLGYVRLPPAAQQQRVRLNLNLGLNKVVRRQPGQCDEKIDHLLKFIASADGGAQRVLKDIDVVCFRGLLRLLMCTPNETRSGWSILACRHRGIIYLNRQENDNDRRDRLEKETKPYLVKILSYGYKLEQYLTVRGRRDPPTDPQTPVVETEEFCCMFRSRLEEIRLLFGAEIDGVAADRPYRDDSKNADRDADPVRTADLAELNFVEIKVNRRPQNQRQYDAFYEQKARNWWAQSFLVGVERIVVGDRDDDGIVGQLYEWQTSHLASESKRCWSAAVCLEFCAQFLRLVRTTLEALPDSGGDADATAPIVVRFDYDPRSGGRDFREAAVMVRQLDAQESEEHRFVHDWYLESLANESLCNREEGGEA